MSDDMNRRSLTIGKLFGCFFAVVIAAIGVSAENSEGLIDAGEKAFARGGYRESVAAWEKALAAAENSGSGVNEAKSNLGAGLIMLRETERARALLREALAGAKAMQNSKLSAAILNDLGNLSVTEQAYGEAIKFYEQAAEMARAAQDPLLVAKALSNWASAAAPMGNASSADELNARALKEIARLENSHEKGFLLLTAGRTDRLIGAADDEARKRIRLRAHQSFSQALEMAEATKDSSNQTYALGYLGDLYDADGQGDAALALTRRAVFTAQQAQAPEALYRWQGQTAGLLKKRGDVEGAISSYQSAVATLQTIRSDVSAGNNAMGYQSFRESEGPLFLGLADLLLEKAKGVNDPAAEQALLREARDVVEQLKNVELESYLCDECVNAQRANSRAVEAIDKETAVIYLVPLPNRTEILVGLTSGLKRFTVEVGAKALAAEARQFRSNLETRTSYAYLEQAQQLYSWLIRPIKPLLQQNGITTLVFVPDGAIRTIPFATLHDGEKFLIQEMAVAVVPGLSMVEPKPLAAAKVRMLLNGLSQPVQGFSRLDFVPGELQSIEATYPSEKLFDERFTLASLKNKLGNEQFSVVHIASHGQFDRDVRKTFVLTHDDKLTLNELEALIRPSQYRGRPVELLVLSACQTAAGDDRAALGLAGVAVKAGARSALATLWFVNDQSTSELVTEVYRQLQQTPGISKAKALQAAQNKLLVDRRFKHPCYWSPYLLIGNWL
jgi:CHAT domain-containing protein